MSKYIYANIFHSIFGGAHYVNIGVIETLVNPRKVKTKTPTCSLCMLTACGLWPRLDNPLIYMAQNNLNLWGLVMLYRYKKFYSSLVLVMAYQLGTKPLPKPMMTLPEGANLCGISINFCTVCAAVSMILMTYPVISKHFRYFFQFLQIQVEETYFSMKPLWFWTCKQKCNWKVFVFCPFLWLFYLFIHFQTFSYFSSLFCFRWKKPISSRKP